MFREDGATMRGSFSVWGAMARLRYFAAVVRVLMLLVALGGAAGGTMPIVSGTALAETHATPAEKVHDGKAASGPQDGAGQTVEMEMGGQTIFSRAWQGGFIVFFCLLVMISLSIVTWAI